MVRLHVSVILVLALSVNVDASFKYWNFWSRFTPPWEPLMPNSYNIQRAANVIDANSDGYITRDELLADLNRMDANGDRRVTRYEYVRYHVQQYDSQVETAVARYDSLDSNGDNYLTAVDVDVFKAAVQSMDADTDPQLSVDELQVAMRQADLQTQMDVKCSPTYVYRLPPADITSQKRRCVDILTMDKNHLFW